MNLLLLRKHFTDEATEGELLVDGEHVCYTLEDPVREGPKVYGKTAIPFGRYRVVVTHSPRFKRRLPLLENVPGFDGIRIHAGNAPEHTEGCILVGDDPTTGGDAWIGRSRVAFDRLFARIDEAVGRGEEVWIEIVDARVVKEIIGKTVKAVA